MVEVDWNGSDRLSDLKVLSIQKCQVVLRVRERENNINPYVSIFPLSYFATNVKIVLYRVH